jgi:hypothetical protein
MTKGGVRGALGWWFDRRSEGDQKARAVSLFPEAGDVEGRVAVQSGDLEERRSQRENLAGAKGVKSSFDRGKRWRKRIGVKKVEKARARD